MVEILIMVFHWLRKIWIWDMQTEKRVFQKASLQCMQTAKIIFVIGFVAQLELKVGSLMVCYLQQKALKYSSKSLWVWSGIQLENAERKCGLGFCWVSKINSEIGYFAGEFQKTHKIFKHSPKYPFERPQQSRQKHRRKKVWLA